MLDPTTLLYIVIVVALLFDFLNGMNDAANSIATIVGTRVLSPLMAVGWAAMFNFIGAFILGTAVAKTIGGKVVDPAVVNQLMILAALVGAIAWTYGCTYFGVPISVSHALIGGLVGAGIAKAGLDGLMS